MSKCHYTVANVKDQKPTAPSTQPTISTDPNKDSQYGVGTHAVANPPGGGSGGSLQCSCNCTCNCAGSGCGCACAGSATMKKVSILRKKL